MLPYAFYEAKVSLNLKLQEKKTSGQYSDEYRCKILI